MNNMQAKSAEQIPSYVADILNSAKRKSEIIVLVTGVFDILHSEHQKFLIKAKKLGDVLIIAIESDKRVTKMKGKNRPINSSGERAKNLSKLGIANCIFVLPNEFNKSQHHNSLIKTISPDIFAVSSHTAYLDKKQEIMSAVDGKLVVVHAHNPNVSSTKIIENQ